ncbi:542b14ff-5065-4a6c-b8ee-6e3c008aa62e [Thermothielavioides terrestris]|uniref:542b14ff-5065-4a6c-b8ee-6e3c008aa62e n=1 Tax=Thermothielavioides terrestris TaxID=2587410 RepID=A0A3S4AYM8_9PEZI|nr:542b14ff-5065-4a6c-b8ee-6e3c008aa62e [Thermothielavioides terrestris]
MCTQTYYQYHCGCRQKGEFEQCDRLYNLNVNLQCADTVVKDHRMRSYCAKHLLKEGKASVAYRIYGDAAGKVVEYAPQEAQADEQTKAMDAGPN